MPAGNALNAASVGANTVKGPWPFSTSVSSASFRADTSVLNVELAAATSAIVPGAAEVRGAVGEAGVWAAGLAGVVGAADAPGAVPGAVPGVTLGVVPGVVGRVTGLVGLVGLACIGAVGAGFVGTVIPGVLGTVGVVGNLGMVGLGVVGTGVDGPGA